MKPADFRKDLGPGLLWAATAIGTSHLVQATRAGAEYGFALVGVVVLAHVLKYPFFEFGPRYAAATGRSLLEGYRDLGWWPLPLYVALTIFTMFIVVGAIGFVTGSLATQLFGDGRSPFAYSVLLLAGCVVVLIPGRYAWLDRLVKVIVLMLAASTLAAVTLAMTASRPAAVAPTPSVWDAAGFAFLLALVGWMPSAIDVSVWHSLWTLERAKTAGRRPTVAAARLDFNIGYFGSVVMAIMFLGLGALILNGTGVPLAGGGADFAAQLVGLYSQALGGWSRPIIVVAAFTAMLSTLLTVVDGFPRALRHATELMVPKLGSGSGSPRLYWGWMLLAVAGALLLTSVFRGRLTAMVDLATTLSFLTAPVLGYINLRVVTSNDMPADARPELWLLRLSWAGLAFGVLFGLAFLVWRFFPA